MEVVVIGTAGPSCSAKGDVVRGDTPEGRLIW